MPSLSLSPYRASICSRVVGVLAVVGVCTTLSVISLGCARSTNPGFDPSAGDAASSNSPVADGSGAASSDDSSLGNGSGSGPLVGIDAQTNADACGGVTCTPLGGQYCGTIGDGCGGKMA